MSIGQEPRWRQLADRFLPIVCPDPSPWRCSSISSPPRQGWKIHVSATIANACNVLEVCGPVLQRFGIHFKGPKDLGILAAINTGLDAAFSQIGKFLTAYPGESTQLFCALSEVLAQATQGISAPCCPFENRVRATSPVSYRYGAYGGQKIAIDGGEHVDAIADPSGRLFIDRRETPIPPWIHDPFFARVRKRKTPSLFRRHGVLVKAALVQRGKGGVYSAMVLHQDRALPCILKQARRNGEVDLRGRDARERLLRELTYLKRLRSAGLNVPSVISMFRLAGDLYAVLELIAGIDCFALISQRGLLRLPEVLWLSANILPLLEYFRLFRCAWRDLKPHNLIVREGGATLFAIDFEGTCRFGAQDVFWGSPGYSPPEALDGTASPTSDVFSLGATMLHALTGQLPPANPSSGTLEGLAGPYRIKSLLRSCLNTSPRERPTIRELRYEIDSLIREFGCISPVLHHQFS